MSFVEEFNALPLEMLRDESLAASPLAVRRVLERTPRSLGDFALMISPAATGCLEEMGRRAHDLTRQRFGRVMRLFAPLYLSNECINNCRYCGFSRDNPILRVTLSVKQVEREALQLREQGFRSLLLVAGEHPKFVSQGYLESCLKALAKDFASLSLEVGPMETAEYRPLVGAGAEGLVVYQETYDRSAYESLHLSGPKRDFDWRLGTPERAYTAGFRRIGIGALYGLSDWRKEALSVAAHALSLLKSCWKAQLTISLPRLRPCAGEFQPLTQITDRDLAQLICAYRLMFPDVGLVLSTREPAGLRDGLMPLGITLMSAGSHTEPGGYTGAGRDQLHRTEKGRIIEIGASEWADQGAEMLGATGQFEIADGRSAGQVADVIRNLGYEPVWKDWDSVLSS